MLAVLVCGAALVYSAFALLRWIQLAPSGFDLGIFDQVVWHYSRFETPANTVRALDNIWGDHFSPIFVVLVPFYWLGGDARVLLIGQAVLLASAAVPICLYARDRLGRLPGYLLAGAYLGFWGVQSALAWEFHELAFVPVLMAGILFAVHRRSWRWYFALVLLLLCAKEDQSIVAIFLGLYVLSLRAWRQGAATIALGVVWYVLIIKLLIPHFSPTGEYGYWSYEKFGDGPLEALKTAVTDPGLVLETLFDSPLKRETLAFLFIPFLGLMLCSRTAIVLLPLVAQRFLSSNGAYWYTDFHYTLSMAAILFIGAADGLANLLRFVPPTRVRAVATAVAGFVLVANVVSLGLTEGRTRGPQRLWDALNPISYATADYVDDANAALDVIPSDASVVTQDNLLPRLTDREGAFQIRVDAPEADYVVANVLDTSGRGMLLNGGFPNISRLVNARLETTVPIAYHNGWLVLKAPPGERTPALEPVTGPPAGALRAAYDDWLESLSAYSGAVLACNFDQDCLRPLGAAYRADEPELERALAAVSPAGGCAQLVAPARDAAPRLAAALEALRTAPDAAQLAKAAGDLRGLADIDAPGFVTRFVGLCVSG